MYDKEIALLGDELGKVIENKITSRGRKVTPEIVLHHLATINAVAKVKNGEGSPYDIMGGAETMDQVAKNYPLELNLVRNIQKFMKNPGNENEINSMLNTVRSIIEGMATV